jgi:hypothetical protein
MKMKTIELLFDIKYGVNMELNSLSPCDIKNPNSVNFVSRTAQNNGVSAVVERLANVEPLPAGTLSVAGGGSVLETFLQPKPYYSGRDLFYLTAKVPMSDVVKLYYCACIRTNKYRYNYGRQANKTLKDILVPDISEIPEWINKAEISSYSNIMDSISNELISLSIENWKPFKYEQLFDIERGTGPRKQDIDLGNIPFVTSTDTNNGISAYTNHIPTHNGNTIGVNRNGSVAEAFYQEDAFCSTEDVHIFNPKFTMNKYIAMFFITLIRKEKYRYSYGRKWGIERMKQSIVNLPVKQNGSPDFEFMENFIKSLPYSASI